MKASLKFREDQRPLARAKIPISILGIPFLAGAAAGEPSELRLDLSSAFDYGPAFRVFYRPNDRANAFTFAVKTGIGAFGSPVGSPISMTAEFNVLQPRFAAGNPGFSVLFKPRLGDFSFKKSATSLPPWKPAAVARDVNGEKKSSSVPDPVFVTWIQSGGEANGFTVDLPSARGGIGGLLSGMEVMARSFLPLHSRAAVRFQWGLRMPPEIRASFSKDRISIPKLPMFVMSKISVEHVSTAASAKVTQPEKKATAAVVTSASNSVRRELEALRKAVEELREEVSGATRWNETKMGDMSVSAPPVDVSEELKRGTMDSTSLSRSPLLSRRQTR